MHILSIYLCMNPAAAINLWGGVYQPLHIPSSFLILIYRVRSRALVIPFSLPCIGPTDIEGDQLFQSLDECLQGNEFSSCIGWVVKLGKGLMAEGRQFVGEMRGRMRDKFSSREATNWSILLWFLEQVQYYNNL